MKRKIKAVLALGTVFALLISGCGSKSGEPAAEAGDEELSDSGSQEEAVSETAKEDPENDMAEEQEEDEDIFAGIETAANGAGVSIHDPSIKVYDGRYYLYGSHMTGAYSDDMQTWTYIGNTYNSSNPLFEDLFAEGLGVFDYAGTYEDGSHSVWAEDVIYNTSMEKYVMYFCTSSTYIKSKLCYATADQPEGPYVYQGDLLYSGFTAQDIGETDVCDYVDEETASAAYLSGGQYNNKLWPNCIDPAPFYDEDGRLWMVYGSWSGGIFLLELDPETGLVIHPEADEENEVDPYFGKRLLGGGHNSIEGPYIQYDESSGYYYLYVSYGG